MTPNNNLSVLPFYSSKEDQNHFKSYAYGNIYPLYTPLKRILPFQIIRPSRTNSLVKIQIIRLDGLKTYNVTTELLDLGIKIYKFNGYDIIQYNDLLPLWSDLELGKHYLEISDGVDTWFSDIFTFSDSIDSLLKITWWDKENLYFEGGHINYDSNFKNYVYLKTQIGKPDYKFEEEGENRDGFFFPEKQLSEKVYNFTFMAPEYLCDAMRILRMSDFVEIQSLGKTYKCDTIQLTPKWQAQGDLAAVEAEFQCDTVIKKIGKGYYLEDLGDFNRDFNGDFKNL